MPGLIIGGRSVEVPGRTVLNWHDDPRLRLKLGEDARRRTTGWVRLVVMHTTKGLPVNVDPSPIAPDTGGELRCANWWSTDPTPSGAHLVVDHDGSIACLADLLYEKANHAGPVNEVSIGVELYQGHRGEVYEVQLAAAVDLTVVLCRAFKIQPQYHSPYRPQPVPRLATGGIDCVGVVGHRDITRNRGEGDPGNPIFDRLRRRGFRSFDYAAGEDRMQWRLWQRVMTGRGADIKVDGIPGPATCAAVAQFLGRPDGLYWPAEVPAA